MRDAKHVYSLVSWRWCVYLLLALLIPTLVCGIEKTRAFASQLSEVQKKTNANATERAAKRGLPEAKHNKKKHWKWNNKTSATNHKKYAEKTSGRDLKVPQLRWNLERVLSAEFDGSYADATEEFQKGARLWDSSLTFMGRVEIPLPHAQWGTICGDGWTVEDATVVCRQLGFQSGGVIPRKSGEFGPGQGPVVLSKVKCRGDETNLEECDALRWDGTESLPCSQYLRGASVVCGCVIEEAAYTKTKCFLYTGFLAGSLTCHHSCVDGMILVGDRTRTCTHEQKWTGLKPYCVSVDKPRGVCQVSDTERLPCNRESSKVFSPRANTKENVFQPEQYECISLGCCYDSNSSPSCYLPADSSCMTNSCKNGAQCKDTLESKTEYECLCSDGFGGETCEYEKRWICGVQNIQPNLQSVKRFRRVVGGRKAVAGSWPWIVQIKRKGRHICAGTLIHRQWVLTAAHCVNTDAKNPKSLTVSVSRADSSRLKSTDVEISLVEMANYTNNTIPTRDIALLKLAKLVDTEVICLPRYRTEDPKPATKCWVAGWGDMKDDDELASPFYQADLPVLSKRDCQDKRDYDNHYDLVNDNMICAGYSHGGVDTCNGDSGGPLMCLRSDGSWYVAGIVSWGYECGDPDSPGVYTRVTSYLEWIYHSIYRGV